MMEMAKPNNPLKVSLSGTYWWGMTVMATIAAALYLGGGSCECVKRNTSDQGHSQQGEDNNDHSCPLSLLAWWQIYSARASDGKDQQKKTTEAATGSNRG